jgi:hypothetical protein
MRYFRILYLTSEQQPDVLNMTCNIWNDPVGALDLSMPQILEALGDYFDFELPLDHAVDVGPTTGAGYGTGSSE